jgi:hypothetical protein
MATRMLLQQSNLLLKLLVTIFTGVLFLFLLSDMQMETQPLHSPQPAQYQDQPLLDLTNFHYLISPYACQSREEIRALLVITSHSGNLDGRKAWRNGMPTKV